MTFITLHACADTAPKTLKGQIFDRPVDRALTVAACNGQVDEIQRLIDDGANVDALGDEALTPLIWAVACQNKAGVKALLDAGADPNLNADGRTAMLTAPTFASGEIVQMLIDYGGNVNAYRTDGVPFSALDNAYANMKYNNQHVPYEVLLGNGADITFRPPHMNGETHVEYLVGNEAKFDWAINHIKDGYNTDLEKLRTTARVRAVYDPDLVKKKNELLTLLGEKLGPIDFSKGGYPPERDENDNIIVDEFGRTSVD